MSYKTIEIKEFNTGMTDFEKDGGDGANAQLVQALQIHEDPSYMVPVPIPTKVSGSIVTDLPKWMVDTVPYGTNKFVYGGSGNMYKVTSSDTFTLDRSGATIANGAAGQGLQVLDDWMYYSTSTTIGRYGLIDATPTYNDDLFSDGTVNLDQSQTKSGQTYTTPTSITENATNQLVFIPTRDPIKYIAIIPTAKGTGNWTLTVHDSYNNVIGSATVANASLTNGVANNFTFATPLRVVINNSYHFHVTSTVADGTVQTGTTSDLSTANYSEYFGILIADTNFHPMALLNGLVIGNGPYLAYWNEATYNPNKIVLDKDFTVRSLWKENEFVVAGCWRGTTIDKATDGMLYYWDGISTVFNYSTPVTAGAVNAGTSFKNRTFTILGSSSQMYIDTTPFRLLRTIPSLNRGKKLEVYPGAITQWEGRTFIGFGGSTDDSGVLLGVYGYGNSKDTLPEVLTYDFQASSGVTTGTTMQVGMVKSFGKDMYMGYYDGASYFVDKVTKTGNPMTSGSWQSIIIDGGNSHKIKRWGTLVISFVTLATGETVTPKYRTDRSATFTLGTQVTSTNATPTFAELVINTPSREIEIGFDWTVSNTFLKIISLFMDYDDGAEEKRSR